VQPVPGVLNRDSIDCFVLVIQVLLLQVFQVVVVLAERGIEQAGTG
jgi:hypothetical protein